MIVYTLNLTDHKKKKTFYSPFSSFVSVSPSLLSELKTKKKNNPLTYRRVEISLHTSMLVFPGFKTNSVQPIMFHCAVI